MCRGLIRGKHSEHHEYVLRDSSLPDASLCLSMALYLDMGRPGNIPFRQYGQAHNFAKVLSPRSVLSTSSRNCALQKQLHHPREGFLPTFSPPDDDPLAPNQPNILFCCPHPSPYSLSFVQHAVQHSSRFTARLCGELRGEE